ncbi:hypothetical protein ABFA07_017765 [Porites harrisoni]
MKSIGTKMESLNGLNNKTSGLSDAVKSLKAKVESLIGWINKTLTSQPAPKPTVTSATDFVSSCKEQYEKNK